MGKIYLCIEKLDKYIHKLNIISYRFQSHIFDKYARREIFEIYTDETFWIIESKKPV